MIMNYNHIIIQKKIRTNNYLIISINVCIRLYECFMLINFKVYRKFNFSQRSSLISSSILPGTSLV